MKRPTPIVALSYHLMSGGYGNRSDSHLSSAENGVALASPRMYSRTSSEKLDTHQKSPLFHSDAQSFGASHTVFGQAHVVNQLIGLFRDNLSTEGPLLYGPVAGTQ